MSKYNQTPEEKAMYAERARARDRAKKARRSAKRRAERAKALKPTFSKTSAEYRRRFLVDAPAMTKSQLTAFLAQAVRNTPASA